MLGCGLGGKEGADSRGRFSYGLFVGDIFSPKKKRKVGKMLLLPRPPGGYCHGQSPTLGADFRKEVVILL